MKRRSILSIMALLSAVVLLIVAYLFVRNDVSLYGEEDVYPCGVTHISCTLRNTSLHVAYYGETFSTEKFVNDEWIEENERTEPILFQLGLADLFPLCSRDMVFPIHVYSSFDTPGLYRIVIHVTLNGEDRAVYYPFTIEDR